MHRSFKAAAIACMSFTLAGLPADPGFSIAALDALDPARLAQVFCGGRRAGASLASELLIASAHAAPASAGGTIPLYPDLAASPFPVSAREPRTRAYFSQGLLLTYGFNHAGTVRSFREAQRLEPGCASCWWGEALALGPTSGSSPAARPAGGAKRSRSAPISTRRWTTATATPP